MLTPGGGGFGDKEDNKNDEKLIKTKKGFVERGSVYEYKKSQESV